MAGQPIPVSTANSMIKEYINYMTKLGVDMNKQTQYVSFTSSDLLNWQNEVMPFTDEFRVFLGVYPKDVMNPGRMTVIIWPYKDGNPATQPAAAGGHTMIDPYNEGSNGP